MTAVNIAREIEKYFLPSPMPSYGQPKFIIFSGCIGSGKTTERRKNFSHGYVTVDACEIFCSLTNGGHGEFGKDYFNEMNVIGFGVLERAVMEKQNIVMEMIGAEVEMLKGFTDAILSFGYKVHFQVVDCEPVEAYERHVNAGMNDPSYISAYHTEPYHMKWVADLLMKLTGRKGNEEAL
jgi:hypothetical protein